MVGIRGGVTCSRARRPSTDQTRISREVVSFSSPSKYQLLRTQSTISATHATAHVAETAKPCNSKCAGAIHGRQYTAVWGVLLACLANLL
jgi:hypothetical protein